MQALPLSQDSEGSLRTQLDRIEQKLNALLLALADDEDMEQEASDLEGLPIPRQRRDSDEL